VTKENVVEDFELTDSATNLYLGCFVQILDYKLVSAQLTANCQHLECNSCLWINLLSMMMLFYVLLRHLSCNETWILLLKIANHYSLHT
jgi:hypothetical protein